MSRWFFLCPRLSGIKYTKSEYIKTLNGLLGQTTIHSFATTTTSTTTTTTRVDPTAKRPNQLCDPYGQQGKPLGMEKVSSLKRTIHEDWNVEMNNQNDQPVALSRTFAHPDYRSGARFVSRIAAVAEMNAHYPTITLDRRIVRKSSWQVCTTITCHTLVLGGLSTHDFYLAMVRIRIDPMMGVPYWGGRWATNPLFLYSHVSRSQLIDTEVERADMRALPVVR